MAKYVVDSESLTAIADAIREKTGKTESLTLAGMPTEVASIEGEGNTAELEAQIADLTAENTELESANATLTAENTELESANATLTAENAELTARIEELENGSGGSSGEKTTLAEFLEGTSTEITAEDLQGCTMIRDYAGIDGYNACFANLTSVTIPASVTYIGEYAIALGGISITLLSETPPTIYANTFGYEEVSSGMTEPKTIYVPASAVDTYKAATNWSVYADWIQAIEGTESGGGESGYTFPTAEPGVYEHGSNFTKMLYAWDDIYDKELDGGYPLYDEKGGGYQLSGCIGGDIIIPTDARGGYEYPVSYIYDLCCGDIVLPENVTYISVLTDFKHPYGDPNSEIDCHLETIYVKATTPPGLTEAFTSTYGGGVRAPYLTKIVVPKGCGDAYKSATNWSASADIIVEADEGGNSSGGSTDQTSTAGAYTDATFTTRAYTWDELLERGDYNNNGGMYPYENPPCVETMVSGYAVYGEDYAFVIPDTITNGVATEGCKAIVFPSTTTEFANGMDGTIGTLYIKATTPPTLPWEEYFADCNYNGINGGYVNIVVPVGCGNAYKTATNWSEYADYITEGEMPI